jgi:hypothetical protein
VYLLDGRLYTTKVPRLIELDLDAGAEFSARIFLSVSPSELEASESLRERIEPADTRLIAT